MQQPVKPRVAGDIVPRRAAQGTMGRVRRVSRLRLNLSPRKAEHARSRSSKIAAAGHYRRRGRLFRFWIGPRAHDLHARIGRHGNVNASSNAAEQPQLESQLQQLEAQINQYQGQIASYEKQGNTL